MKYYLKIFNKNIVNGSPKEFVFDEDAIYTNNYNETLDSFSGRISHLSSEIEIDTLDTCAVIFKNDLGATLKTLYFCVDNFTITQDTIGADNEKVSYEIELYSQTKLLEGIICPNLSITPYKLNSGKTRKSIYWYLDKYLGLYGEKIRC